MEVQTMSSARRLSLPAAPSKECLVGRDLPKINYGSLKQICQLKNGKSHHDIDHARFMKEYPQIFVPKVARPPSEARWRTLSAHSKKVVHSTEPTFKIRCESRSLREPDSTLSARLNAMITILEQHPPLRSHADVKQLGLFFSYFPSLFENNLPPSVLGALAARAVLERVKDRNGQAFPRDGAVYLIIKGTVKEVNKENDGCKYRTRLLGPGEIFGELKEPPFPPKHSYPVYQGLNKSLVMRVTLSDYVRAKEIVHEEQLQKNLQLILHSNVLSKFPQNAQQKLARLIKWRNVKASHKLLQEGEAIKAVSIIKKGHCKVLMRVPDCTGPLVCIGEISESGCVGELYFDEPKRPSPYTVIATTNIVIGQIDAKAIDVDLRTSRAPSQKFYSVTVPSNDELQTLYAERLVAKQWQSLKRSIVSRAYH